MGVLAKIKGVLGENDAKRAAVAVDEPGIQEQRALEQALAAEMTGINDRIRNIEASVLNPLRHQKQQLAALKAKRLQSGAAAYIDGKPQDLKAIDGEIATQGATISALEKDADMATHAVAQLTARLDEKRRELQLAQQEGLRTRVRGLEIALRELAPEIQSRIDALKDAIVEMSALAMARDELGPQVPGNTPIGSRGLAELTVAVPHLPAYEKVGGFSNLYAAADARKRQILQSLDVR